MRAAAFLQNADNLDDDVLFLDYPWADTLNEVSLLNKVDRYTRVHSAGWGEPHSLKDYVDGGYIALTDDVLELKEPVEVEWTIYYGCFHEPRAAKITKLIRIIEK